MIVCPDHCHQQMCDETLRNKTPGIATVLCPGLSCTPAGPEAERRSQTGPLLYPQNSLTRGRIYINK